MVCLGHKIDHDGLHPTDEKVREIQDAPHPTNVKELRAWLGLLNYYDRFLCNLSTTLAPLHVLLRKETKWQWGKDQNEAFVAAKNLLQSDSLCQITLADVDPVILESLDATEGKLAEILERKKIRGKFGRRVAVLLTPQIRRDLDKIREKDDITRPYLFASKGGNRPYRG